MWTIIPSFAPLLQGLAVAFTEPSFRTHTQIVLGWLMCVGARTEYRVFRTIEASAVVAAGHHPFDRFYNFFSRSAWTVESLAHQVCVLVVVHLCPAGVLYLVVDDTLLHKRGIKVYGLGWFRDAVASTAKRVATASGNNWVVLGLAIPIPLAPDRILCLPLRARLHLPGKDAPSCVALAKEMLGEILAQFPDRRVVLIGDGAYAAQGLLGDLDRRPTTWAGCAATRRSTTHSRRRPCRASVARSRRRAHGCPGRARRRGGPIKARARGRGKRSR